VVGIWNEAFDLEGAPAQGATTVPGIQRVLKEGALAPSTLKSGVKP
jgi:type IV secretion system protein VirB9